MCIRLSWYHEIQFNGHNLLDLFPSNQVRENIIYHDMSSPSRNPWLLLRFLILSPFCILEPILPHISEPAFRPSIIGLILILLAATSMMELFLLYVFGLIRFTLIVMLVGLGGAQFISWLSSEEPLDRQKPYETFQKMESGIGEQKNASGLKSRRIVGSWPP
jgi:hypothetical protein